jgi:hypothetical protein
MARHSTTTALHAAQRTIDSADKYRASVTKLHATSKLLAEMLHPDGRLMEALHDDDVADNNNEMNEFLETQKRRLRDIAEGNAKRMKEVDYFVAAVTEVKNEMSRQQNQEDEKEAPTDYEASIHQAIERIRDADTFHPETHPIVIELKTILGEKSNNSNNDDDDLEIVTNTNDVHAYKCPVTGLLFENPVKNKVCGHTYDMAGLRQVLKNRKHTCPIPGCTNQNLNVGQVEEDEEMKMKVHRFKKREEQEKKKRELEDEEREEEMEEQGGFTMIQ